LKGVFIEMNETRTVKLTVDQLNILVDMVKYHMEEHEWRGYTPSKWLKDLLDALLDGKYGKHIAKNFTDNEKRGA
jgi:hypothetical protein